MPGQSATPRPPASRSGSALQPNSLPPRLGLGAGVRRMSPRRWLLLLTLCLQLTGAVPQRGAPASVDCELKPQVRRAGCARAASRRLSGRYLPNPTKHQVLRPQADSSGCKAGSTSHRGAFLLARTVAASVPLSGGGAALWPPKTLSLSPRRSPAQGSPGGVSWVSPASVGGIRETNLREECGAETWAHLLWNLVRSSLS